MNEVKFIVLSFVQLGEMNTPQEMYAKEQMFSIGEYSQAVEELLKQGYLLKTKTTYRITTEGLDAYNDYVVTQADIPTEDKLRGLLIEMVAKYARHFDNCPATNLIPELGLAHCTCGFQEMGEKMAVLITQQLLEEES